MVNTYETIGIGVSIALMAVALFLVRFELSDDGPVAATANDQVASVVVASEDENLTVLQEALNSAQNSQGELEKLIADDVVIGTG